MQDELNKQDIQAYKYPHESAGRVMIEDVPTARPTDIVRDVREDLFRRIHHFETINYIYIVNGNRRLIGVSTIKDLLRREDDEKMSEIMKKDPIVAKPHSDQEHVAYLALRNNIKAIPVVNRDGRFLGVVPSDRILDIMYTELSEDIHRLVGVRHPRSVRDDVMKISIVSSFQRRVPWLFVGLVVGILIASIIGMFEHALKENLILVAFIPLIVYMSSAVGMQMEAFIIRDLAITPRIDFANYLKRHLSVVMLIAISMSAALFFYSLFAHGQVSIARVLGVALFATITSSVLTGLLIPYAASRVRIDPADVGGPIATSVQDMLSIVIYFGIASVML